MEEHSLSQRLFAETLGTAILVLVGPGAVVATLVLAGDKTPAIDGSDLLGISFAFGLVITALVYAIGKISGCHINPAVTFGLASTKRFPWPEVPDYWAAQLVGGMLGALGIWALFTQTGIDMGLGAASFNEDTYSWGSAIFAEFLGRRSSCSRSSASSTPARPGDFAGIVIGGVVVAIIMVLGPITAASLNPARAFGPSSCPRSAAARRTGTRSFRSMSCPALREPAWRRSPTTSWRRHGRSCSRSRAQSPIPTPPKPSRRSREEREWLLSRHR